MSTESAASLPQTSHSKDERRFSFGRNWQKFLKVLDAGRLERAVDSLREFWPEDQSSIRFLDIGSGSGTFSLAAWKLGADVHSFDYDEESVACTRELKSLHADDRPTERTNSWNVEQGSVLDLGYLKDLGKFDIVYSWGVLHHTGAMWPAIENAASRVKPGGLLIIAIYNDQGWKSRFWKKVKKIYCSGWVGQWLMTALFVPFFVVGFWLSDLLRFRNPFARYRSRHDVRGMSVITDIIDWIGGYPFEVASPREIKDFHERHGFELVKEKSTRGLGCNEFVFRKSSQPNSEFDHSERKKTTG